MFHRRPHNVWIPPKSASVVYTGPADVIGVTPIGFWALRAMSAASLGGSIIDVTWNDSTPATYSSLTSGANIGLLPIATTMTTDQTAHGSPGVITRLYDQSGNGHHFTPSLGGPFIIVSGNGAVQFNGTSQNMLTPSFSTPLIPFTIECVANHTASASQQVLTGGGGAPAGGGDIQFRSGANNTVSLYNGSAGAPIVTCNDGVWTSIIGNFASPSSNSFITVGGADSATGNPGTGQTGAGAQSLGSDPSGGQLFTGLFVELGYWSGAFTGTQRTNMYNNHHTYWGV